MIRYFDWLPQLESHDGVYSIENEIAVFKYSEGMKPLFQSKKAIDGMRAPHKFNFFMFVDHTSGSARLTIDMEEYNLDRPFNVVKIAPGQIVTMDSMSDDFDALVVLFSTRFLESMMVYVNGAFPFRLRGSFDQVEHYDVSAEGEHHFNVFYQIVRHCLQDTDNPYRLQMVQHLIMAMFYSSGKLRELEVEDAPRSNADVLTKEFMSLVKENFRRERQLQFYADALCITPRYLSRVVKECTGESAAEWIERCVVLEARALLKSTNMTIQQISDELNFPSQTFFGKYFKRRVGLSPKEYRRVG